MKMYLTIAPLGFNSNGFTLDARGTSWLTGFTLSAIPSVQSHSQGISRLTDAPVTQWDGPQPFGRKRRI